MTRRDLAAPLLGRAYAVARACRTFVDNLPMLLRIAFIAGALLLARDLRNAGDHLVRAPADTEAARPLADAEPAQPPPERVPALSDRTRHFLNCTYEAYRRAHYDECVTGPSAVYPRPPEDPDDMGLALFEEPVRFARLDP